MIRRTLMRRAAAGGFARGRAARLALLKKASLLRASAS